MIKFNVPPVTGNETKYISAVIDNNAINNNEYSYTKMCSKWIEQKLSCNKAMLTSSGTHALEMAAMLINTQEGDEIIMPSFTFPSSANAFVLKGAKIVFVDIRPDTMNINENLIEDAITDRTKAIVPVHYGGVACEMDTIMDIAQRNNLYVIEDAAQAMMAQYKGKQLGTIGHIGIFSFHETKNYVMGEGGAILINDTDFIEKAEIIIEKGTNRSKFLRGEIDAYSWVDAGSSYIPAEINAAYLYAQLENANKINVDRLKSWNLYNTLLQPLSNEGTIEIPFIPADCNHNAHMYFIKCADYDERNRLINHLKDKGISTVFHYIPLHSSKAGKRFTRLSGEDNVTTKDSKRLLRLPMYYKLKAEEIEYICVSISEFYRDNH